MNELDELNEWLNKNGLNFKPVLNGQVNRFTPEGAGDERGWYVGSCVIIKGERIYSLTVSSWNSDEKLYFRSGGFSNGDLSEYREQIEKRSKDVEKEKERKHEEAAKLAAQLWASAKELGEKSFPYLERKQIRRCEGLRIHEGKLVIPMVGSSSERLTGLQFISEDGTKKFLPGTRKKGSFFAIHKGASPTIYVTEGYATGFSVSEALRSTVYIAFDAGNLRAVAEAIRTMHTGINIVVCADNDCWREDGKNIGIEKAKEAAGNVDGLVVIPYFPVGFDVTAKPTDWNDVHCIYGIEEVKRQIDEQIKNQTKEDNKTGTGTNRESVSGIGNGEEGGTRTSEYDVVEKHGLGEPRGGEESGEADKEKEVEECGGLARWVVKQELENIIKSKNFDKKEKKAAMDFLKRIFFTGKTPIQLAKKMITHWGFAQKDKTPLLKYYRNEFYRYKGTAYQKLDDEWLTDRINRYLIWDDWKELAGTDHVNKIFNILKIKPHYVGSQIDLPATNHSDDWMGDWESARNIIPLKSHLFDAKSEKTIDRSPRYFFNYELPFDYDPTAQCPVYDKICTDIFSSPEDILIWEEIMGVHIYNPFLIEKMFILFGQGANGKSLLTTVLRCLLGDKNVSSVPIDCFNASNFTFVETLGKLANIIPDMKDVSQIDEGAIKAFVSREEMHFNRKNKPSVRARPTAFLTACTNVLPKFSDKSDGQWRRILLLEFKKQIKQEDQRPEYRDPEFWSKSRELPGIFNKALAGAKRVEKRGYILETEDSRSAVEEYRQELNHTADFARECLEFGSFRTPSHPFFKAYEKMVVQNRGRVCGSKTFWNQLKIEIERMGHKVELTKKNERKDAYTGKFVLGAKLNEYGESLSAEDASDRSSRY